MLPRRSSHARKRRAGSWPKKNTVPCKSVPISQFPDFLRPLAKTTPVFWAVDGFQKAMQQGAGITAVSTNLLVLGGAGVIFLGLGAAALRRRMAGGLI